MQRRPTSFDIAALAGVSQPTVSRALTGSRSVSAETRARVVAAAEQLHYKVDKNASGLRKQRSATIALLFFEETSGEDAGINPFYLSMLGHMVRKCAAHGYDLLISFQQLSADWHVDYEDSRKADGIVLLGYGDYLEYTPKLEQLIERGTHFVRWGSATELNIGVTVGSDNVQGGFDATTHLLDLGRTRIGFVGTATPAYPEFMERWSGYREALRARGIEPDARLRVDADPSEEAGRAAVATLSRRGADYDALFVASDLAAIGTMHALHALGRRIPEDVAIVGFDDLPAATLANPPLSTVKQDARHSGEALIEALIDAIEDGRRSSKSLPCKLVVRESSAR